MSGCLGKTSSVAGIGRLREFAAEPVSGHSQKPAIFLGSLSATMGNRRSRPKPATEEASPKEPGRHSRCMLLADILACCFSRSVIALCNTA